MVEAGILENYVVSIYHISQNANDGYTTANS